MSGWGGHLLKEIQAYPFRHFKPERFEPLLELLDDQPFQPQLLKPAVHLAAELFRRSRELPIKTSYSHQQESPQQAESMALRFSEHLADWLDQGAAELWIEGEPASSEDLEAALRAGRPAIDGQRILCHSWDPEGLKLVERLTTVQAESCLDELESLPKDEVSDRLKTMVEAGLGAREAGLFQALKRLAEGAFHRPNLEAALVGQSEYLAQVGARAGQAGMDLGREFKQVLPLVSFHEALAELAPSTLTREFAEGSLAFLLNTVHERVNERTCYLTEKLWEQNPEMVEPTMQAVTDNSAARWTGGGVYTSYPGVADRWKLARVALEEYGWQPDSRQLAWMAAPLAMASPGPLGAALSVIASQLLREPEAFDHLFIPVPERGKLPFREAVSASVEKAMENHPRKDTPLRDAFPLLVGAAFIERYSPQQLEQWIEALLSSEAGPQLSHALNDSELDLFRLVADRKLPREMSRKLANHFRETAAHHQEWSGYDKLLDRFREDLVESRLESLEHPLNPEQALELHRLNHLRFRGVYNNSGEPEIARIDQAILNASQPIHPLERARSFPWSSLRQKPNPTTRARLAVLETVTQDHPQARALLLDQLQKAPKDARRHLSSARAQKIESELFEAGVKQLRSASMEELAKAASDLYREASQSTWPGGTAQQRAGQLRLEFKESLSRLGFDHQRLNQLHPQLREQIAILGAVTVGQPDHFEHRFSQLSRFMAELPELPIQQQLGLYQAARPDHHGLAERLDQLVQLTGYLPDSSLEEKLERYERARQHPDGWEKGLAAILKGQLLGDFQAPDLDLVVGDDFLQIGDIEVVVQDLSER